jgi:hypothetical protein
MPGSLNTVVQFLARAMHLKAERQATVPPNWAGHQSHLLEL